MNETTAKHKEYFFEIDERGNVLHNGVEIDDKPFIHVFFTRLKENTTGKYNDYPYYSPSGYEINFVQPVDTPIVYQRWENDKLWYHDTLSVPFEQESLTVSDDGILYHTAKVGGKGRIAMPALMHLTEHIEPFGEYFQFRHPDTGKTSIIEPTIMPSHLRFLQPRKDNTCFGCGDANPHGLQLSFLYNEQEKAAESWFVPPSFMNGSLGIMHGGFVALLLDEVMGKTLSGQGVKAPTGTLNVRYHRPTPIGQTLYLKGKQISEQGRKFVIHGEIRDEHHQLLAEAEGLFIRIHITT
ncbi:MAG: DUF4505 family protein [Candidatus Kapaibacterium sp.]